MPNHHPKPEPIKLGNARTTYATAYANRPPTKRMEFWSWKMVIHSDDVENNSVSLGRLAIRDVRKKMEQVYKEQQPRVYANEVEKQSFVDLMEMWYFDVVVPRLPEAKIRDEFKLSKRFANVATEQNIPLLPFFLQEVAGKPALNQEDGIHPTAEGHIVMADSVLSSIKDWRVAWKP